MAADPGNDPQVGSSGFWLALCPGEPGQGGDPQGVRFFCLPRLKTDP